MDEYSQPATLEDLKALIASLNEQGADYLLIGGYALFAHGYHRATTDIDVLVPATLEAGMKVRQALMVLPDQAAKDIDLAWFEEGANIRVADAFVVDIMLNACGETFETLKQYAETVDFDGVPVQTINLEGLIRTKQTQRDKDIADRHILERALEALRGERPESDCRFEPGDPTTRRRQAVSLHTHPYPDTRKKDHAMMIDNGRQLRSLIESAGMTQLNALAAFNRGQARPLSVSQWKAYLANPESARRRPCPDTVINRASRLFDKLAIPQKPSCRTRMRSV